MCNKLNVLPLSYNGLVGCRDGIEWRLAQQTQLVETLFILRFRFLLTFTSEGVLFEFLEGLGDCLHFWFGCRAMIEDAFSAESAFSQHEECAAILGATQG